MSLADLPVPLDGPARIAMTIDHDYQIVRADGGRGPWKVTTAAYYYAFDPQDGRVMRAYHWHPGEGNIAFPISSSAVARSISTDSRQSSSRHRRTSGVTTWRMCTYPRDGSLSKTSCTWPSRTSTSTRGDSSGRTRCPVRGDPLRLAGHGTSAHLRGCLGRIHE